MLTFRTETGSVYQIDDQRVRRLEYIHDKRGDGKWLNLLNTPQVRVGHSTLLLLEPLSHLGSDDSGNEAVAGATMRVTSRVTEIEED